MTVDRVEFTLLFLLLVLMMYPLIKPLCLVISSISFWITWTSPNPPAQDNEIAVKELKSLGVSTNGANLAKRIPVFAFLAEALIIILQHHKVISPLHPIPFSPHPSVPLYIGTSFLALAATIRYLCYLEMGRHFTYEVSLLNEHKLITTGPYSAVRHPGYTGILFAATGNAFLWASKGSWVEGLLDELSRHKDGLISSKNVLVLCAFGIIGIWTCWLSGVVVTLMGRMKKEDKLLKNEFKEDWVKWEKKVPWRLIPGVY